MCRFFPILKYLCGRRNVRTLDGFPFRRVVLDGRSVGRVIYSEIYEGFLFLDLRPPYRKLTVLR